MAHKILTTPGSPQETTAKLRARKRSGSPGASLLPLAITHHTGRSDAPEELYGWYVQRAEAEGRIKYFKLALNADRLGCHRFFANQFRLLLHAAAYWLLDALRTKLIEAGVRRMQLDTLRLLLIKIGGRVRELLTKVRLHLASGHPGQRLRYVLSPADPELAHE